jgi:hypothetical protein
MKPRRCEALRGLEDRLGWNGQAPVTRPEDYKRWQGFEMELWSDRQAGVVYVFAFGT